MRLTATSTFHRGAFLLVLIFGIMYASTIDTGLQPYELQGGDLITHQYAQVQARPSNAPGYPLYTMGGWLWFHGWRALLSALGYPYANPLPILSTYSTIWAILALYLLYSILGHLQGMSRNPLLGTFFCLLVAAFFGVTYFFWYYATTTEQYSSAVAQTLAIVYYYLKWDAHPTQRNRLYWLAFLCGLSLAHMLTVAFIVPPLVAVILWRDPTLLRSPRVILASVIAAVLPLTSYLYVYLRGALHPEWWGRGAWSGPQQWFLAFISTAQGRDELAWAFEPGRSFFGNGFPETIWHELSLPLLIVGMIGITRLPRRHALLIFATLAIYTVFCWLYRFGNWFQVVLPAYPLVLLGLAPLYASLQQYRATASRVGRVLVLAALIIALVWRANLSLPTVDSRDRIEDTALDHAAILLNQPLPTNASLFATVDDALALDYLTTIWGIRSDLRLVSSSNANAILRADGKVYVVADALPTLLDELDLDPALDGLTPDWIELIPIKSINVASAITSTVLYTVTPELYLAGLSTQPSPSGKPLSLSKSLSKEPSIDVRLTWYLPTGVWPKNVAISLRPTYQGKQLIDPITGNPIQQDRPRPLYGLWRDLPFATSPETLVAIHDPYRIAIPTAADGLLLILYATTDSGFANLAEISLPFANQ